MRLRQPAQNTEEKKNEIHLLFVGPQGGGKSTLLAVMTSDSVSDIQPTMGKQCE